MKKLFHIFLTTMTLVSSSYQILLSQSNDKMLSFKYFTWVKSMDKSYTNAVYLTEINDSSVIIMNRRDLKTKSIMINDIESLHFRKRNNEIKGFLYGGLTGLVVGGFAGLVSGDDDQSGWLSFTAEQKAVFLGIIGVAPGALIGGIIGSRKIKIPINGNFNDYNFKKKHIEQYKYLY